MSNSASELNVFNFLNEDLLTSGHIFRDPALQQISVVRYEGELDQEFYFNGEGRLVSNLGYTFQGDFSRGLFQKRGKIQWSDGTAYEGTFLNNCIEGQGKYTWGNGDWYEGEVHRSIRHGKGKFFSEALKETYEGDWDQGARHGVGTLTYQQQPLSTYTGEWSRDMKHGKGTLVYPNGDTYEGDWADDARNGFGRMIWKQNGITVETYEGEWKQGVPHGHGRSVYIRPEITGPNPKSTSPSPVPAIQSSTSITPNAVPSQQSTAVNSYVGEFQNGQRHGFGTFFYDDGSRYEGYWVEGEKHGEGKFSLTTGMVYIGLFEHGSPTTQMEDLKMSTTVATPVPLHIRDLLGLSENNTAEAITGVQSVVSRHHGHLRKAFRYYSALDNSIETILTPSDWKKTRTQGTLSFIQFLRWCSDARLLNRGITMVEIGRLMTCFKDVVPNSSASTTSPLKTGESPELVSLRQSVGTQSQRNSIHSSSSQKTTTQSEKSPTRYTQTWETFRKQQLHLFQGELSFREFVEIIVRTAAKAYPEDSEGLKTLAQKVSAVLEEHALPFTCTPSQSLPIFPLTREHKAFLVPHRGALISIFVFYSSQDSLCPVSAGSPPLLGRYMTFRAFLQLMKAQGVVDDEKFTITKLIKKVFPYDKFPQLQSCVKRRPLQAHPPSAPTPRSVSEAPHSSRTSTSGALPNCNNDDPRAAAAREIETHLRNQWIIKKLSAGIGNHNVKNSLVMERHLTFPEFVELLLHTAIVSGKENVPLDRIANFFNGKVNGMLAQVS